MEWGSFEGKTVAKLRLFCERKLVFYSVFCLPQIPNQVLDKFDHDKSPLLSFIIAVCSIVEKVNTKDKNWPFCILIFVGGYFVGILYGEC